ncbi:hypothetical protein M9H77_24413 [Catharanthus roseus]|uniref:Uncharacterized protein n=1 Tax=Catharanthus roseus TaxID=4058 RepID=A0ACC0AXS5_CATRO|nr:hypothetical protein M9H77_24413 [Catharanthus roseus]
MVSIFTLFAFILFIIILTKWFYTSSPKTKVLPPSPPKLPIIGNFHQLGSNPHRSLQSLAQKYGPLMLLHFGTKPVLVVSSADVAKEIMKIHDLIFSSRPKLSIPDRLMFKSKDVAISPYGEYWRHVRSICVLHLLNNKRVQSFRHVREEETSQMIEKIRQKCFNFSPINMTDLFSTLTNDIICRIALGKKYGHGKEGKKIKGILREFIELLGVYSIADYIPSLSWINHFNGLNRKVERVASEIDELMEGIIEEHSKRQNTTSIEEHRTDFVDILLDIQRNSSSGFAFERDTLKALILDMFAAGTDTTHSIMEWATTELLRHPKVMEKLQNEVRKVGQGKSEIDENDIEKMQYLKAVIKETLRLRFPVRLLVPRESVQDIKIQGYDVSAGTQVIINGWAIARDPNIWENPEEFEPERFLNCDIDFKGMNFEFIPFGAGRRGCPGMSFGVVVNELVLAKLMHKFNFALPEGEEENSSDVAESTGITVHRKYPLFVVATPYSG